MEQDYTVFRIMIASPGDVKKERAEIIAAIDTWNANHSESKKVILRPLTWEIDVSRGGAEDCQQLINEQILRKSDMAIGIFWKTLGRKSASAISYTVGELQDHINQGKQVVLYFKEPPKPRNPEEAERIRDVLAFKSKIHEHFKSDNLYTEFKNIKDFKVYQRLEKDIDIHLLSKVSRPSRVQLMPPMFKPITFFTQNSRPAETQFLETIKDARKFYFVARTGVTFLGRYRTAILDALSRGCECRFIIMNKDAEIIRAGHSETDYDSINADHSLKYLASFKNAYPDKVSIHLNEHYPPFDIEFFESFDGKRSILIQMHFLLTHQGPDRPMFMLYEGDYWYSVFLDELDATWNNTKEWENTP